jgi:hypothetical protein
VRLSQSPVVPDQHLTLLQAKRHQQAFLARRKKNDLCAAFLMATCVGDIVTVKSKEGGYYAMKLISVNSRDQTVDASALLM